MSDYMILVWVAIGAFLVYWFVFREATPLKHRELNRERLLMLVRMLYFRGADGAELFIEAESSGARLTVMRKEVKGPNNVRLVIETDLEAQSASHSRLRDGLRAQGVEFEEMPAGSGNTARIIVIVSNETVATNVVMMLALASNVSLEKEYYLYVRRVSALSSARIGWEGA